jgi:hypothetical protein
MICWDRKDDLVIGHFTPHEIGWLRRHLDRFSDVLRIGHILLATDGTGVAAEHACRVVEAHRYATVIAARGPHDEPSAEDATGRELTHLLETYQAVESVLETLPAEGGVVLLTDSRFVLAWIWALYDYGMSLACRLDLPWRPLADRTPEGASEQERSFEHTVRWLLAVVDGLINTADLPTPALNP